MTSFSYTAKRNVQAGHTIGETYSFDVGMQVISPSTRGERITRKSLSGLRSHYLFHSDEFYDFQTIPIASNSVLADTMREFLASTLGGEVFNVDPYGTIAVPDESFDAEIENPEYAEQRIGTTNYVTFSFKIRKV